MSKKITHKEALEIQDKCIERGVNAEETIELLNAVKKVRDKYGSKCIDLDETIKDNTGRLYNPRCFTVRFCDGSHTHYVPSLDMVGKIEKGMPAEKELGEFIKEGLKWQKERQKKKKNKEVEIPIPANVPNDYWERFLKSQGLLMKKARKES